MGFIVNIILWFLGEILGDERRDRQVASNPGRLRPTPTVWRLTWGPPA